MWWFLACVVPELAVEAPEVRLRLDLSTCDGVDDLVEAEVLSTVHLGQPTVVEVAVEPDFGEGMSFALDTAERTADGTFPVERTQGPAEVLLRARAAAWCSLERPVLPGEHEGAYDLLVSDPFGDVLEYVEGLVVLAVD